MISENLVDAPDEKENKARSLKWKAVQDKQILLQKKWRHNKSFKFREVLVLFTDSSTESSARL